MTRIAGDKFSVGARLRTLRVRAGLSQTKAGRAVALDQGLYSRIESGRRKLLAVEWFLLADAFHCSLDEIVWPGSSGPPVDQL